MKLKMRCHSCGSPYIAGVATTNIEPICGCCAWKFRQLFLPKGADLMDKLRLLLPCVKADPGLVP